MTLKLKFLILILFTFCGALGQVSLPSVFSDNMVLQQKSSVHLWGTAFPSFTIDIVTSWNNKKYKINTGVDGSFSINLTTPEAGGPFTISFDDGKGKNILENVLIGEVWLCAGQSNMDMPMKGFTNQPVLNSEKIIAQAKNPELRIFTTEPSVSFKPKKDSKGEWEISSPSKARNTSAVAFQYGQMLQKRLEVPVGIIISSWGGTPIKSWMSKESLEGLIPISHIKPDTITSKTPAAL
jgi:sialate O-acetylesterase